MFMRNNDAFEGAKFNCFHQFAKNPLDEPRKLGVAISKREIK